ncbi:MULTISPECIES: hypothetical protein [unclassified Prochlorococcus]|uniref:hypothetical protein n=1 Tax=unclassified Prochlorococcus TaxID=2627481 RepID=UPI0005337641|nr:MULTISPECIES: hypothetical protein [unclassified Prochlorococcus]KGG16583.1 hypothetical protein EV06_0425 [Prochlorococcus sp. MIT 0602]KGG16942.1 hypothetical protein EV07_0369 [Prochlorococcus sp. MIT 0603]
MLQDPYLIALALIEQSGKRAMPLGGRSIKEFIDLGSNPGKTGEKLINDLLLRVFQKSETGSLRRVNSDESLLLIQIPMLVMQEKIPLIKKQWMESGDSQKFIAELHIICGGIWKALFTREEGLYFLRIE